MLEGIQTYFTKTVSELNYFHKPVLFEELKTYLKKKDRKKVFVYFGNSRALLFSNKYIEEKYPEWIFFNFSVPGGTPDYFTYWLEKFKEEDVRPDFILVDDSVEAFNLRAKIKIDEVLVNGLDFKFLLSHADRYSSKEITNFIAKKLFKTYQYRPKLEVILSRLKNNSAVQKHYKEWRRTVLTKLTEERGNASSDLSGNRVSSDEVIQRYSEGDFNSYIENFTFNENMLKFQKDNFDILNDLGVPHASIWVRVAPAYFKLIKTRELKKESAPKIAYDLWYEKISKIHKETGTVLFNMNEDESYKCNLFTDASHMSSECFPDYTDYIFKKIIQVP